MGGDKLFTPDRPEPPRAPWTRLAWIALALWIVISLAKVALT